MSTFSAGARALLAALVLLQVGCRQEPPASSKPQAPPPAAAPEQRSTPAPAPLTVDAASDRVYTGPLPPLPVASFAPPRPMALVQAVYEFAARRPDVLRYVPCYCGCQRNGHQDNADCFVSSREADGRPRWDLHGMG
jgi:hypothetical protein